MVLSGLSFNGEIRQQGEVLDIPDSLPLEPDAQAAKWNGKVYYVAIKSKYDNVPTKNILRKQEDDPTTVTQVHVSAQLSDEGKELFGEESDPTLVDQAVAKTEERTDLNNTVPGYYDAQQKNEFTGMDEENDDDDEDEDDEDSR